MCRTLVFYCFYFLTASQVDLLKSLSLRDDILIPIYKDVYEESIGTDWINWFDQHNLEEVDLSVQYEKVIDIDTLHFPKGYLSKVLTEIEIKNEVVLATKALTRECIQEIPLPDKKFKTSVDLFSSEYNNMIGELDKVTNESLNILDLKQELSKSLKQAAEEYNFRRLKCYSLFYKKLEKWEEIVEEGSLFDEYSLKLLDISTSLDLTTVNLNYLIESGVAVY